MGVFFVAHAGGPEAEPRVAPGDADPAGRHRRPDHRRARVRDRLDAVRRPDARARSSPPPRRRTTSPSGGVLLAFYSLGLAVPFLLTAIAFDKATMAFRWLRDRWVIICVVSGVILIAMGLADPHRRADAAQHRGAAGTPEGRAGLHLQPLSAPPARSVAPTGRAKDSGFPTGGPCVRRRQSGHALSHDPHRLPLSGWTRQASSSAARSSVRMTTRGRPRRSCAGTWTASCASQDTDQQPDRG